ncbi:P-loop containing nucleoside triphosphate hydrolase protein [Trametes maxima]|nr:P-loop containing nucleoside triphosphate hydrolase protein [Trametes maxima]
MQGEPFYILSCVSLSTADPQDDDMNAERSTTARASISRRVDVYPIAYHPDQHGLKKALVERGRKWASLSGVRHLQYVGIAGRRDRCDNLAKYSINSRVMLDRGTWKIVDANYDIPTPDESDMLKSSSDVSGESEIPLTNEELLLASPILYGFSLSDKIWLEFNVNNLSPIVWNDEAFASLVLPPDRKDLLRSLIEAHAAESVFDDFVRGKGQGLVINLFGPPGVGKTLSAEATSEYLRRPLYVVSSGELGTSPSSLDDGLDKIFEIAARWNAIVLIDEADVFLEERSLHDILRNAMVAVFLRHIEYYRGILFLTTNRITTFDEAFLSRIHVALHFDELPTTAKLQIWRSFLKKAGVTDEEIPPNLVQTLADRNVNGRQIKNACRTAASLARSRGERLTYQHLVWALDAMEEFLNRFADMKREPVEMEK